MLWFTGNFLPVFFMKIVVNGEEHGAEEPLTVAQLLQRLNLRSEQVAVEINLKILDRGDFPTWNLHDGDKVEILSFIGGGSPI
jgi:thiamine biosynthesis protein ThiS